MSSDNRMDAILENMQGFVSSVIGGVERPDPVPGAEDDVEEIEEAVGRTMIEQAVKAMIESPRAEKAFKRAGVDVTSPDVGGKLRGVLASSITLFLDEMGIRVQDMAQSKAGMKALAR